MNTTSNLLEPLTVANAPAASKPTMEGVQKAFGFIPNLMGVFANSPEMLKGYLALDAEWDKTSFTPQERNFAVLAASLENECGYCIAAHSTVAKAFQKVPAETVAAIRAGQPTGDKKTDALITLVRELVSKRGHASRAMIDNFLAVGFTKTQVMELLMAVALKSLPFGTAYAVWTGIGAAGSILLGMLMFSEPADPVRILCLTLIVAGMIGLKLNSPV